MKRFLPTLVVSLFLGTVAAAQGPIVDFSATPLSGNAPLSVDFTDTSIGTITIWAWDFGDTSSSSLQNPTHVYTAAGTYTVALVATGPLGTGSETKIAYISVTNAAPIADFSGTPTSGTAPLNVTFSDLSSGTVTSWAWTFGDGGTSSLQNPSHSYAASGTYDVSLTATGPGGSSNDTKVAYIAVTDPAPVAEFTGTPTSGTTPLNVAFSDLSSGVVTSWAWTFGDGGTSSLENPSHVYSAAGTYSVALTATGPGGSDVENKINYIVANQPAPVADFSGSPTSGTVPLVVAFNDLSSGAVTSWSWTFGDGGTSTLQNPSYNYASAGTYDVTLTATGPGGSDPETKLAYVTVNEQPPVAAFSGTPTSGQAPLSVAFSDLSSGVVTAWSWSFGDGGVSSLQNPTHVYTQPGSYTVLFMAIGPGGSDSQIEPSYITVDADLLDPDFELQTAGTAPSGAWTVTQGTAHVIRPTGVASDLLMPAGGTQWCEISADGSDNATPPSNPGGVTSPAVGGSGISQVFRYPSGTPSLLFEASFIRNEPPMQTTTNDWMSVDISDGSTTVNVFYKDTFSTANETSAIHGLAATKRETLAVNLETTFPGSTPTTAFTLTIQVGNGGDAGQPSLGYVDRFRFAPNAESLAIGCGVNPAGSFSIVSGEPRIGSTMVFGVDNPVGTQSAGSVALVAISVGTWPTFPCGINVPTLGMNGPGELLIQTGPLILRPLLVGGSLWAGPGMPAPVDFVIPVVPSIVNFFLYAQGLMLDLSPGATVKLGLADAYRLLMGV